MRRKTPRAAPQQRFRKIERIRRLKENAIDKAKVIDAIIPKGKTAGSPILLKKKAIEERKKQNFVGAADLEYQRLVATLNRKGSVSDVTGCLNNLESDFNNSGLASALKRTQAQKKYLKQILHYYKYPGY